MYKHDTHLLRLRMCLILASSCDAVSTLHSHQVDTKKKGRAQQPPPPCSFCNLEVTWRPESVTPNVAHHDLKKHQQPIANRLSLAGQAAVLTGWIFKVILYIHEFCTHMSTGSLPASQLQLHGLHETKALHTPLWYTGLNQLCKGNVVWSVKISFSMSSAYI